MADSRKVRLIAFYLPQFHKIPENDEWWGKGFTEWTNAAKAKPLFRGHYQPHIPADLGFYDLLVPETRAAQAELARAYGIEGFMYWHYWFGGKRLLERPFNEVLASGQPDFPFCLGWANETWSGIWAGCPGKTLIGQTYPGQHDERAHFYEVLKAFQDSRYIQIDGKPLFLIYKPENLPEPKRFTDHWRELAVREGLNGIYFIGEDTTLQWNPVKDGFDASIPHCPGTVFWRLERELQSTLMNKLKSRWFDFRYKKKVFLYKDFIRHASTRLSTDYEQFNSVLVNWDNTPRSGERGYVLIEATPELFKQHLQEAIEQIQHRNMDKRVIFVKSWNEWAEGNHLEPDLKYGKGYLEVCRELVARD
ncbi:MAG: glycosyltransferase WbsX family protein [Nitrospirota bacterium]